jgi:HPt (histidine-containing phosphotransfer) domain-containing protein
MEVLSFNINKIDELMSVPFGSLNESIIELNMEESAISYSLGFRDKFVKGEWNEKTINLINWIKKICTAIETNSGEYLGQLSIAERSDLVLYLIDSDTKKTNLFFFEPLVGAKSFSELLFDANNISRFDLEMFNTLQSGTDGMDEAFLEELIGIFLTSVPMRLNKLAMAMKERSWDDVIFQAHYMKSIFGVMGFERLSWLVGNLEQSGKTKEASIAFPLYHLIYPELVMAVRFLRKNFHNITMRLSSSTNLCDHS